MLFHMIYNMAHKNLNMTAKKNNKIQIYEKITIFTFNCFCLLCYLLFLAYFKIEHGMERVT